MDIKDSPYKMSFAVGGLLLNESVEAARLHVASESWATTLRRALDGGVTSLPKVESRRRTLREIVNRISKLSDEELSYLVKEADRCDQQALLWVAACRAYRFVHEFATEVIRERFLSYQFHLPPESFDILFATKAEWNVGLAKISPTTRAKLRQVLFRMMREANIISEDNRILSAYASHRFTALIGGKNPEELNLLPGLIRDGGAS